MRRYVFLPLLCAILIDTQAAGQVFEVPSIQGTGQIVRTIGQSNDRLIYVERTQGQGTFVLVNSSTVLSFDLLAGMRVRDFETYGGMVYFCGSYGGHGLVGLFDIQQSFVYGAAVEYVLCTGTATADDYDIHVSSFSKIDLNRRISGADLALIGDAVIDSQYLYSRTVPTSVVFGGSSWVFTYFYNKDGTIHYTDNASVTHLLDNNAELHIDDTMDAPRPMFVDSTSFDEIMSASDSPFIIYMPNRMKVMVKEGGMRL